MVGGNGDQSGGQIPMVIVPRNGIVILKQSGLSAGIGAMTKVGDEPLELETVVLEILTSSEV